ncbi:uncharacterized protein [Antedon mediterranea]|uniref:uncharacterized protein n=1 Tax=Antedon mediterranea TaxID=105859 RepID=UPI003AF54505
MAAGDRDFPGRFAHITAAELDDFVCVPNTEPLEYSTFQQNSVIIPSEDVRPSVNSRHVQQGLGGASSSCYSGASPSANYVMRRPSSAAAVALPNESNELVESSDSFNTRKQIKYAVGVLSKYAQSIGSSYSDIESLSATGTDAFLAKFYASIRRHDGSLYTQKSMHGIKFGLQRHYQEVHGWDIIRDKEFRKSKKMFKTIIMKLRQAGLGFVKQRSSLIEDTDLSKILNSLNVNTPLGLQNKVYVDISMNFSVRGRTNFRNMKKGDYIMLMTKTGHRYITHTNQSNDIDEVKDRMYEQPGYIHCPLQSFFKYTSKLHPNCDAFWQMPKKEPHPYEPWYCSIPIGENAISSKTRQISISAGCLHVFTNGRLRATGIQRKMLFLEQMKQSTSSVTDGSNEVLIKEEKPDFVGYLQQPVSSISTKHAPGGDIGQAVILANQGVPEEDGYLSNSDSDMSSVIILEDDEDDSNDIQVIIKQEEEGLRDTVAVQERLTDRGQTGVKNKVHEKSTDGATIASTTSPTAVVNKGKGVDNTHCRLQNETSDDEETAEEREQRGIKTPFNRLTERHFIAVNKGRTPLGQPCKPSCIVCSSPGVKRHRTEYICEQCVLPMCPTPCFKRYHTMAEYKITCSDSYHNS